MTTEHHPKITKKVYAYITQGDDVLVFRHVDAPEAGIQVPGGTVQPGESLPDAVLREAFEETGLPGLRIVAELGESWLEVAEGGKRGDLRHRHFFHLRCATPLPATWQHAEGDPSDGGPPILFEFFWLPLTEAPEQLIAEMGMLAHLLKRSCQAAGGGW